MPCYFISDLHLQPSRENLASAFFHFVETRTEKATALYILGDFFDAWIGDDEDHPFYRNIMEKLRGYNGSGLDIYFQHGNRDFLVGQEFAQSTGVTLLDEETVVTLAGQPVLLMHGDSLCIDDQAYMQFRKQVRDPQWQQQILALPLEQRRAMAAQLREQSQSMNAMKAEDIMDVNTGELAKVLEKHTVKTLIHGHTHRPNVHHELGARRIVLGDWGDKAWFAVADDGDISLQSFTI